MFIMESIDMKMNVLWVRVREQRHILGAYRCFSKFYSLDYNLDVLYKDANQFSECIFLGSCKNVLSVAFKGVLTFKLGWLAAQKHCAHELFSQDKSYQIVKVRGQLKTVNVSLVVYCMENSCHLTSKLP